MNKRNSSNSRVLLDTSFLLPVLGFETSKPVMEAFHRLHAHTLYYSDLSILEALWKIVKTIRGLREEIDRIVEGVEAIRRTMEHAPVSGKAVEQAIKMYKLGHRDIIDNLLYSIAASGDMKLLTVDEELVRFIEEHSLPRKYIVTPEEIS